MKVLVTGAGGYIGSQLIPALLDYDFQVFAVDTDLTGVLPRAADTRLTLWKARADDPDVLKLIKDVDAIVPLAAYVGAAACERSPEEARRTNLLAIQKLDAVRGNKPVVFLTTDSGYRPGPDGVALEDTPFTPTSHYARTKYEAEQLLLASGNTVSFRLGSLYGVSPRMRDDLLLHYLVRTALQPDANSADLTIFEPHAKRSFVHVLDVVENVVDALSEGRADGVTNLASEAVTKKELAERIEQLVPGCLFAFDVTMRRDEDARDFILRSKRQASFFFAYNLSTGIRELARYYSAV